MSVSRRLSTTTWKIASSSRRVTLSAARFGSMRSRNQLTLPRASTAAPLPNYASFSSEALMEDDENSPTGDLFHYMHNTDKEIGPGLIGKVARIRRTFHPQSNADAMIVCGGEALAAHASFDPDYMRAQEYIRHRPVGPAVLSPILISGLTGALVEATFPNSVPVSQFMKEMRPLIVGVPVIAHIEVTQVIDNRKCSTKEEEKTRDEFCDKYNRTHGYQINLSTKVLRLRDEAAIAEGSHSVWIPEITH